jgi:hypothetical protein
MAMAKTWDLVVVDTAGGVFAQRKRLCVRLFAECGLVSFRNILVVI